MYFFWCEEWKAKMENKQNTDIEPDYTDLAATYFDKYGPSARKTNQTAQLPDELVSSERKTASGELVICDQITGKTLANITSCGTGEAIITVPADYTGPMDRKPFEDISKEEDLSPSGELIFELMECVHRVIVSRYAEVTAKRKIIRLVEQLHQDHGYSPEDIRHGVVEQAQKRGDLPDTHS
jgi:hypothetical protein